MSWLRLAFSSDGVRPLTALREGERGVIVEVQMRSGADGSRIDRLLALGISPGATVTLLQRFPSFVFLCDQTELAVERAVADGVLVRIDEAAS